MVLEAQGNNRGYERAEVTGVAVDADRVLVQLIEEEAARGLDAYQRGENRANANAAISLARIDAMIKTIHRLWEEQPYIAPADMNDDF